MQITLTMGSSTELDFLYRLVRAEHEYFDLCKQEHFNEAQFENWLDHQYGVRYACSDACKGEYGGLNVQVTDESKYLWFLLKFPVG